MLSLSVERYIFSFLNLKKEVESFNINAQDRDRYQLEGSESTQFLMGLSIYLRQ